jgi:hypothetical protein
MGVYSFYLEYLLKPSCFNNILFCNKKRILNDVLKMERQAVNRYKILINSIFDYFLLIQFLKYLFFKFIFLNKHILFLIYSK